MHHSKRETPRVILFITSPYTLLCGMAFARQKGLDPADIVAVDYLSINPNLLAAEAWMAKALGIQYFKRERNWFHEFNKIIGNNKVQKFFALRGWRKKLERYTKDIFEFVDPEAVTDIIVPYRVLINEIILTMCFPKTRWHFIPDGYVIGHGKTLELSTIWRMRGADNFYGLGRKNTVWTPEPMVERMAQMANPEPIENRHFEEIYDILWNRPELQTWLEEHVHFGDDIPSTVFMGQILGAVKLADPFAELAVYKRILDRELREFDNRILVKMHPRDNETRSVLLHQLLSDHERVRILPLDRFSNLPVELFFARMNVTRAVGFTSTSMLSAASAGIATRMYDAVEFSTPFRKLIKDMQANTGMELVMIGETEY